MRKHRAPRSSARPPGPAPGSHLAVKNYRKKSVPSYAAPATAAPATAGPRPVHQVTGVSRSLGSPFSARLATHSLHATWKSGTPSPFSRWVCAQHGLCTCRRCGAAAPEARAHGHIAADIVTQWFDLSVRPFALLELKLDPLLLDAVDIAQVVADLVDAVALQQHFDVLGVIARQLQHGGRTTELDFERV